MTKLEVKNLRISFRTNNGAVQAVRDISFSLNPGETLAVAGESGSGKSVTARAIMGILAGNAMVEGGEILYDGRDLLKIPEEEFHTLRGHRLAMVFQDPLSALNPIMRIGQQLTEAMILNDKERRADGKKRFEALIQPLEKHLSEIQDPDTARDEIRQFRDILHEAMALETACQAHRESALDALDCLEELEQALLRRERHSIEGTARRAEKLCGDAADPWLMEMPESAHRLAEAARHYEPGEEEKIRAGMDALRAALQRALNAPQPDALAIGWLSTQGEQPEPTAQNREILNARARRSLEECFLKGFLADVARAAAHSRQCADSERPVAVETLNAVLPVFNKSQLNRKECLRAARRAGEAVSVCIDPLELEADSALHVFESTLTAGIERYFDGLKQNPHEEKRYAREFSRYEKQLKKGKTAIGPSPKHLVDTDQIRQSLCEVSRRMIARLSAPNDIPVPGTEQAAALLDRLIALARDASGHLTASAARRRAIGLMKEVGIPEPQRRFSQYPFEFSGGMRQRIVIAIALSANPDILICDEPTTALDVTIQAQILALINRLKKERNLSVLFITHDLGVVANMADRIAVMYAGKIVEYGTAEEVFYDPRHPYTWALLSSMPDLETTERLEAIPGAPPNMIVPPKGDAFAARNRYAMEIDLEEQPPMFEITPTHQAATWLLHPDAPKVSPPPIVLERIRRMKARQEGGGPSC